MICGGCKTDARRVKITMTDRNGRFVPDGKRKEICQNCSPEDFHEAHDPLAVFIPEHVAHPHLYRRKADGSLELKDETVADIEAEMLNNRDEEEALARKRATRRTTPMTQDEIDRAQREMTPLVQAYLARQREDEQADREGTEALIDRWIRDSCSTPKLSLQRQSVLENHERTTIQ